MTNPDISRVREVKEKWMNSIMSLPNVNGVGIGKKNGEYCIQVMVSKKLPLSELSKPDIIPENCDGVDTDVSEVGKVAAL